MKKMAHKVTLIPGEGIGPEVAAATRRILQAAGVQIDWEEFEARGAQYGEKGPLLQEAAVESVRKNGVALKGPMTTAIAGGAPVNLTSPAIDSARTAAGRTAAASAAGAGSTARAPLMAR